MGYLAIYRKNVTPRVVILRPARITSGDVRDRDHDVHLQARSFASWDVYPNEHYPVCNECGEPLPCRAEMARRETEAAAKRAASYAIEGVCPACDEPVSGRQKAVTFALNLRIPLGPPVTYHAGRRECRYHASKYELEVIEADPNHVRLVTCPGKVMEHADGPECSEWDDCRGIDREHEVWDKCRYHSDIRCLRCEDHLARQQAQVTERNAAGDWTVW